MWKFCKTCGKELSDNIKFCPVCGTACSPPEALGRQPEIPPEVQKIKERRMVTPPVVRKRKVKYRWIIAVLAVIGAFVFLYDRFTDEHNPSEASLERDEKWTEIQGINDKFTIMVYMCGTDLESDMGCATRDLMEMCGAYPTDDVNILIYTGGTNVWQNEKISADTNQIWKVVHNNIICLEENLGVKSMADPATLTEFVSYCAENYPANRNALIMWDHGGGSLLGVCNDEKFSGEAMQINEIDSALTAADVKFDFIGFDACLMATVETACMLNRHADYMIGSEEVEPGSGWAYTNWLSKVCEDSSIPTEEIGKLIINDYIDICGGMAPNEQCTLSMVDLTEMGNVYNKLCVFSANAKEQLDKKQFQSISYSVSATKNFGKKNANELDLIDLMDFAQNCYIEGSEELIDAVDHAVVYSAHSDNVSNSNGMAIYLPYNNIETFAQMLDVYGEIGLEGEYTEFVMTFASILAGGQSYNGSNTPVEAMNDEYSVNGSADYSEWEDFDWFEEDYANAYEDLYEENAYVSTQLQIEDRGSYYALPLTAEDWSIVTGVEMQIFYDDGEGYIGLGTDDYFEYDTDGALIVDYDGYWFSLGDHIVPLYVFVSADYEEGYIPCMLNDEQVQLVVQWDEEGLGYVVGALRQYDNGMSMKGYIPVEDGDKIQLLCDYYTYEGEFEDSYDLDEPFLYDSSKVISYAPSVRGSYFVYYVLTDIYNNTYYTEPIICTF